MAPSIEDKQRERCKLSITAKHFVYLGENEENSGLKTSKLGVQS